MVTEELLGRLSTAKSSTELHGRGSRASGTSLVLASWCLPVSSPISLRLITTRPGSSSAGWTGVSTWQRALEGGGDDLGGQELLLPGLVVISLRETGLLTG